MHRASVYRSALQANGHKVNGRTSCCRSMPINISTNPDAKLTVIRRVRGEIGALPVRPRTRPCRGVARRRGGAQNDASAAAASREPPSKSGPVYVLGVCSASARPEAV